MRIDIEPITHRAGHVVGYGRKSIPRGLVGEDADLILPGSRVTKSPRSRIQHASMG